MSFHDPFATGRALEPVADSDFHETEKQAATRAVLRQYELGKLTREEAATVLQHLGLDA